MKKYKYTDIPSLLQGDMTEDEATCYKCGKAPCDFHHILPNAGKKASEELGAWCWLCRECHAWVHDTADGVAFQRELKAMCQTEYETTHSHNEWMVAAHRNYR